MDSKSLLFLKHTILWHQGHLEQVLEVYIWVHSQSQAETLLSRRQIWNGHSSLPDPISTIGYHSSALQFASSAAQALSVSQIFPSPVSLTVPTADWIIYWNCHLVPATLSSFHLRPFWTKPVISQSLQSCGQAQNSIVKWSLEAVLALLIDFLHFAGHWFMRYFLAALLDWQIVLRILALFQLYPFIHFHFASTSKTSWFLMMDCRQSWRMWSLCLSYTLCKLCYASVFVSSSQLSLSLPILSFESNLPWLSYQSLLSPKSSIFLLLPFFAARVYLFQF